MLSSMDSEEDATGYSQRSAYNTVYEELRLKLRLVQTGLDLIDFPTLIWYETEFSVFQ